MSKKTTVESLADEARALAGTVATKVAAWVDDMMEEAESRAPDVDAVRNSAEKSLADVTSWLEDLPARVGAMLPQPAPKKKPPIKRVAIGGIAVGATLAYLFDPNEGSHRRRRLSEKVQGWFGSSKPQSTPSFSTQSDPTPDTGSSSS